MILTIDLEDYYMVTALSEVVKRDRWDHFESRIEQNTHRLLEILNGAGSSQPVKATFFCLGYVAERYPELIRKIQGLGHEIASHGYDHRLITQMTPEEFRNDIRKSKSILEDITGEKVLGYRAPSYSITMQTRWAFEILAETGFVYDSSIFPVRHDLYGIPDAPRFPFLIATDGNGNMEFNPLKHQSQHCLQTGICSSFIDFDGSKFRIQNSEFKTIELLEFPLSTLRIAGQNFPIAGGGYFRLFPLKFTKWAINRISSEMGPFSVFYLHPWEIDPGQPRVKGLSLKSRFRHYVNMDKTAFRLRELLRHTCCCSFRDLIND